MKNNIVLYLPTHDITKVLEYKKILARTFGGCTSIPGCGGGWLDDTGEYIEDDITLLKSFVEGDYVDNPGEGNVDIYFGTLARSIAEDVREQFNQICVSLEINGELHFI